MENCRSNKMRWIEIQRIYSILRVLHYTTIVFDFLSSSSQSAAKWLATYVVLQTECRTHEF